MGVFFWKSEKTEQKVKIDLQLEQNKYRIRSRYQKWYKFLRAPVRHFRRFITPKWKGSDSRAAIGVKMSIDRNA
jgi:hypothetical protein